MPSGAIEASLRKARELTKDNPRQQERFDTLDPLIRSRLRRVQRDHRNLPRPAALKRRVEIVKNGKGKALSDNIDKLLGDMEREESNLLQNAYRGGRPGHAQCQGDADLRHLGSPARRGPRGATDHAQYRRAAAAT